MLPAPRRAPSVAQDPGERKGSSGRGHKDPCEGRVGFGVRSQVPGPVWGVFGFMARTELKDRLGSLCEAEKQEPLNPIP